MRRWFDFMGDTIPISEKLLLYLWHVDGPSDDFLHTPERILTNGIVFWQRDGEGGASTVFLNLFIKCPF